ncbi:Ribonuclease HIII [Streptococcus sp. DD10]|uniref:ribonuclease HIII n=1 Tax=Streptococcus sp. DD10 TaxID=1777878 RepID=UPI0007916BE1|nr:ribonuclease HIII [Streptococcus sp. DD10]KXT74704.1 Ribonuclease HIII [Streptococcus sp. DD10]
METISLTPQKELVTSLIKRYQESLLPSRNPYIQYFLKPAGATISVYTSGKVVIQGEDAVRYATELGYSESPRTSYSPAGQNMSLMGSDEVGNGSYFGGLTVVASFVTPDQHDYLRQLGVDDSKNMTDQRIQQLTPILQEKIAHQALLLTPKKYNEVIEQGYNAVSVKVALHNQALYLLLKQGVQPKKIIIDAFTTEKNYQKYLKNESNHFSNPVTLEEKAEGKYLAVAVSSIIARSMFLDNLAKLGQEVGMTLPSGAGSKSDQVASRILKTYGMETLRHTAKLHFKNTQKAQMLARKVK